MVKVPYRIADTPFVLGQIQNLYSNPHLALKEYPSNSLDGGADDIRIMISKKNNSIIIQDNGRGMSYDEMEIIPDNVGKSVNRGIEAMRAEKAFGLLAYPSCHAKKCLVFSRQGPGKRFSRIEMNRNNLKNADVTHINSGNLPYGLEFDIGTRVILEGIPDATMKRYFTPGAIKALFSDMYAPLLRDDIENNLDIWVGFWGKSLQLVNVPEYKGEKILEERFEVEYRKDGKDHMGEIELYLFVNPKGSIEKVAHYNKGVKVMKSIANLAELGDMPWKSGKLTGFINEDFLSLTPSREAPISDNKRYVVFTDTVKGLERQLVSDIDRLRESQTLTARDEWGSRFLSMLDIVYKDFRQKYDVLVKDKKGDSMKTVVDRNPNAPEEKDENENEKDRTNEKNGGIVRPPVVESEVGEKTRTRRARRKFSSQYRLHFEPFSVEEENLRSKLDEDFGLIRINEDHPNFKRAHSRQVKDPHVFERYLAFVSSKELALGEFSKLVRNGELSGEDATHLHMMTEMQSEFYQKGIELMGIE